MLSRNLNAFCLLIGFVLFLILVLQIKQLYETKSKFNRFIGYKQYVREIATQMSEVEKSINNSTNFIHQLNLALIKQQEKKIFKNSSQLV